MFTQFSFMIDCIVFNAVFNSISFVLQQAVHLSMLFWSSFNQYYAQYSFQATGCFPTVEAIDSGERGMNPVYHQFLKRILSEPVVEQVTSRSQVLHATD